MGNPRLLIAVAAVGLAVTAWAGPARWAPVGHTIRTPWADDVRPDRVWKEYPRPMLVRKAWQNLNGLWDYALVHRDSPEPGSFDGQILVPFAVESCLSGVAKAVTPDTALWYRRAFTIPRAWRGRRVLLHFGAVDWEASVWVNGQEIGSHRGGYDPFTLDITGALRDTGTQEVVVRVWDPTDQDNAAQPRGKQVLRPGGIFYTAVTGIWQTVWIEPVPQTAIDRVQIVPDIDQQTVRVTSRVSGPTEGHQVLVEVRRGSARVTAQAGRPGEAIVLRIERPVLWSPKRPFLYDLKVLLKDRRGRVADSVETYCGMRKISVAPDAQGVNRLLLNNEPLFQIGLLDQGWWPDGLYTAPTDKALRYDLERTKAMGFNMLRKHVKVESQRLYTWADRLGLLVWQDMPSSGADRGKIDPNALAEADRQWDRELQAMIDNLHNHPCIVTWVPFNEGWGQHDTQRVTAWVKGYDPTRLVNNASGWTDEAVGDVRDIHEYPGPAIPPLEDARAAVLGEFGGLGLPVKGHLWKDEGNWGYRSFEDLEAFRQRYTHLIADLYGLVGQGLAAAVYTQTTDCEVEVNGLMTYDRRVCKLDPKVFSSLNRGYLPPRIQADRETFIEPMQAVLQQADPQAQIRYTLDGSDPTRRSRPYSGPIQIHLDTVLKARAFWPDGTVSVPVTGRFKRAGAALPAVETPGSQPGLSVQTFEGQWAELPDFSSLAPVRTGVANRIDLDAAAGATSRFALRFSGYLRVPETDVYAFFLSSDDGARLRISGQDVATHDGVHGMSEVKGEIALQAGWHPIELAYFQADGGMGLQVLVSGPGLARDPIPAQGLCH